MHADRIGYKSLMRSSHRKHMYKHDRTSATQTPAVHRKIWNSLRLRFRKFQEPQSHTKKDRLHTLKGQQHRQVHQVLTYTGSVPRPRRLRQLTRVTPTTLSVHRRVSNSREVMHSSPQDTCTMKTPRYTCTIKFRTSPSKPERCNEDPAN